MSIWRGKISILKTLFVFLNHTFKSSWNFLPIFCQFFSQIFFGHCDKDIVIECTMFWSPESQFLGNFDKTVQNYFINRVTALGQKWSRNRFLYESFTYNSWQKNSTFNVSSIFGHNHLMWETTISLYVNFLPKNVNILPTNHFFLINKETNDTGSSICLGSLF